VYKYALSGYGLVFFTDKEIKNMDLKTEIELLKIRITTLEEYLTEKYKTKGGKFIKPTLAEIKKYCLERKNHVDAEAFYDFYEAKNWMIGKNKMKDFKAAIRTWEKREQAEKPAIKRPKSDHEWITLGAQHGLQARPGESMWDFKSRVEMAVF